MWIFKYIVELDHIIRLKSKLALLSLKACLECKSHNDLLAVAGRQAGHTDIILFMVDVYGYTSVLRLSLLRNIHT